MEGFQLGDHAVLGGDQLVGARALVLEVQPVTSRALFGLASSVSSWATLALRVTTTSVTDRRPRGDRAGMGVCLISLRSIRIQHARGWKQGRESRVLPPSP